VGASLSLQLHVYSNGADESHIDLGGGNPKHE
jgi:hypothetical protein